MSKSNEFLLHLVILLSVSSHSSSHLHKQDYGRPDPLCSFKSYNGGYDVENIHYWASAVFRVIHGYAAAGIWTLVGLGFGIFLAVKHLNGSSSAITEHSDSYYFVPFFVLIFFTFLAVYGTTVGIASITLILVIAALVMHLMHWRSGLIVIIFFCWILTALCWVLTGFHFFLLNFAEDKADADRITIEIGYTVHMFISKLNSKIDNSIRLLGLDSHSKYLRTGLWKICDPFSDASNYSYNPDRCSKNSIPISDMPKILARFTCFKDNSTSSRLASQKFLSESSYNLALAYPRTIQGLFNIFPDLQKLAQCSFLKQTLSDIFLHQCRQFKLSFELLWSSMISLSIIMLILVLVWILKVYQNRGISFSRCSAIPR